LLPGFVNIPRRTILLLPSLIVLAMFFVFPILLDLVTSLRSTRVNDIAGLEAYIKIFTDPYYLLVLAQTVGLGLVVTAITLIFGYPVAYFLARTASPYKPLLTFVIITPLLVSVVIKCYGWMLILGRQGLINSSLLKLGLIENPITLIYNWTGVIIAVVHVLFPFAILSISSVIEGIDITIEESASTLGANPFRTFLHVTFPLSIQGIATGATLTFLLTIGSFVMVLMLGGKGTMVLPLLIYQQITVTFNEAFAAALGISLMVIAIALLMVQFMLLRKWT
jgi:putative spermidine/putrescine transport system permease protein